MLENVSRADRQVNLKDFKSKDILILVVSPGICEQTLNIESELMSLCRDLSHLDGVKVAVRLKPVEPLPVFKDYYKNQLSGCKDVLLTSGEYDLFDFVEVADLVVTSISNAAYDIAQAGLPSVFIDYFDDAGDTEYQPVWLKEQGFPLDKYPAKDFIIRWIKNDGSTREEWTENMRKFVDYFAYRHSDFDAYRRCVQDHVFNVAKDLTSDDTTTEYFIENLNESYFVAFDSVG